MLLNFPFVGGKLLVEEHFQKLRILLSDVRYKYENFGYALGLLPGDVSTIRQTHQSDTEGCFNAVLTKVLNQGVTQENLAKALESDALGYVELAQRVRETTFLSSKPPVIY